jgi:hypothetical protein
MMSSSNSQSPLRRIALVTSDAMRDSAAPDVRYSRVTVDRDRRAHPRLTPRELQWLRETRLKYGPGVRLIDVSAGGALVETHLPLRPESELMLELIGRHSETIVASQVIRCHVAALRGGVLYHGACAFTRPLDVPELLVPLPRVNPGDFIRPDMALKTIVEGYIQHPSPAPAAADIATREAVVLIDALALLQAAAAKRSDPADRRLADLLAEIVPSLKRCEAEAVVMAQIIEQLRRAMPVQAIRIIDAPPSVPAAAVESMYFALLTDSVLPPKVVNVEFPTGFTLDAPQFRLLKASTYLISMLRRWRQQPVRAAVETKAAMPTSIPEPSAPTDVPPVASSEDALPSGWQRIVVRFRDGKLLKGYSNDFHPSRGQLHLKPTIGAPDRERLLVPLADLKALFFVRDLEGNIGRIEDSNSTPQAQGRKIEVTFRDGEVLVGFTLNYKAGGEGFFVLPASSDGNNMRVYVIAAGVRHTRFL